MEACKKRFVVISTNTLRDRWTFQVSFIAIRRILAAGGFSLLFFPLQNLLSNTVTKKFFLQFSPMFHFYTSSKHQKSFGFLFLGDIEAWNGLIGIWKYFLFTVNSRFVIIIKITRILMTVLCIYCLTSFSCLNNSFKIIFLIFCFYHCNLTAIRRNLNK